LTLRSLFHGLCALILAFSIGRAISLPPPAGTARDPLAELTATLEGAGFRLGESKVLVAPEAVLTYAREDCSIRIVFLPTIHRISIPAQSAMASMTSAPRYIHFGRDIPSLSAATVIPRWLFERMRVNVQFGEESPWTSIVLAVDQPPTCHEPAVAWGLLR
jgi:hypothetical protein